MPTAPVGYSSVSASKPVSTSSIPPPGHVLKEPATLTPAPVTVGKKGKETVSSTSTSTKKGKGKGGRDSSVDKIEAKEVIASEPPAAVPVQKETADEPEWKTQVKAPPKDTRIKTKVYIFRTKLY
jgi:hypothetical protein